MTDGDFEVLSIVVSWSVTLPAVVLVIRRDERALRGVELERAWPPVSRDAAIFAMWNFFGLHPLCVLLHFARTRRTIVGYLKGLAWVVGILGAQAAAIEAAGAAVDLLGL